jgi:3'-5' exoribonuclease
MEQILLKEIPKEKDYPIAHLLRISDLALREGKKGHFLQFSAGDKSSSWRWCKKWDSSPEEFGRLKTQEILFVRGKTDVYNDNLQLVADSLAIPEALPDDLMRSLMPSSLYEIKFLKREIWAYIQKMENSFIKTLSEMMITDDFVKRTLSEVPAGLKMHHSYRGGLLTHIYRLLVMADNLVDTINNNPYPGKRPCKINKDIVMFGVIMHDMYKCWEYTASLEYAKKGNLLNHLPMGMIEINRKMDKIEKFPEEIRLQLTHLLGSHHGQVDWGSPFTPKTTEAIILHHLDNLFSKLDPMLEALHELPEGEVWSEKLYTLRGPAYLGGMLI